MLFENIIFTNGSFIITLIIGVVFFVVWLLTRKSNKTIAFISIFGFILSVLILLLFYVPYSINELYIIGNGYETDWSAKDVLSFYGDVLAFIGTTVLGIVAFIQNKKLHEETERREKMNNSRTLPSLSYQSFSCKIGDELNMNLKLDSQISSIYENSDTKYTAYVLQNQKNIKKNSDKFAQIDINGLLKYNGEARCNKIKIDKIFVYYGNSHENKTIQELFIMPNNTNNITKFLENGSFTPLNFRIISRKYYNNKSIVKNDENSVFITLGLLLYDIAGIVYESSLELQYCWNGTRYVFVEQIYTIKKIHYKNK